jgi:cytochrome c5
VNKRDQQFFDGFLLIVGIFVGIIAGVIMLGDLIGEGEHTDDAGALSSLEERIQPVGRVALIGDPALQAAAVLVAATPAAATAASLSGSEVYTQACSICHAAPGVGGAPVFGDSAAWTARMTQDPAVLRDHVLNGFQGSAGVMPPKGGRVDLSDDEVLAGMQYMLEAVE